MAQLGLRVVAGEVFGREHVFAVRLDVVRVPTILFESVHHARPLHRHRLGAGGGVKQQAAGEPPSRRAPRRLHNAVGPDGYDPAGHLGLLLAQKARRGDEAQRRTPRQHQAPCQRCQNGAAPDACGRRRFGYATVVQHGRARFQTNPGKRGMITCECSRLDEGTQSQISDLQRQKPPRPPSDDPLKGPIGRNPARAISSARCDRSAPLDALRNPPGC